MKKTPPDIMNETIEAIAKGGVIEPLKPVKFEDNELLHNLRLSKPLASTAASQSVAGWRKFSGSLRSSPNFSGDPVTVERKLRDEWS